MEFKELREKYKKFIYKEYKIEEDEENIYLRYVFEIEGLTEFEPYLIIAKKTFEIYDLTSNIVKNIAFNLGMVEAISYYKATCAKDFIVKCGSLKDEQIEFFEKLIYLGLGEFRYINNIKISKEDLVNIKTEGEMFECENLKYNLNDIIVPIGGGKDSNVTAELLKQAKYKRYACRVHLEDVSRSCANIAGIKNEHIIEITRKMDKKLFDLNAEGYLNGHTPFSALYAFIVYFVATVLGKKYVALSNEDSANESNVKGENINHQYSKTLEFENDFREYVQKFISPNGPEYFSFLRPISEFQIAKLFSEMDQYHKVFRSCNKGSKYNPWIWCCDCPKCLFAFIILSPFLYNEKLIDIFGEDLYEKESMLNTFIELCGYGEKKPFECVGTYNEVRYAISQTIRNAKNDLPFLLKYYKDNFELIDLDIVTYYNEQNNLPEEFDEILRGKIFDVK